MDPVGSVVAVIGAATKALEILKAAKGAPEGLSLILSDLSRLELVFQAVQRTSIDSQDLSPDLKRVLDDAKSKLLNIDCLVQYTLTKADESAKVDRWQWLRKEGDLEKLRKQVETVRQDLTALITATNSTTLQQVVVGTEQCSLRQLHAVQQNVLMASRQEDMLVALGNLIDGSSKMQNELSKALGEFRKATSPCADTLTHFLLGTARRSECQAKTATYQR